MWGLGGTGVMLAGQVSGTPGAVAAGWVMQAQAHDGGIFIAQRLLDTRWYPYLERLGKGTGGGGVVAAPLLAFLFVQAPPLRPIVGSILGGMIGAVEIDIPATNPETGETTLVKANLWEQIQVEVMQADQEAQAQASAQQAADVPPPAQPMYDGEPEPQVQHRSKYADLGGEAFPPEI